MPPAPLKFLQQSFLQASTVGAVWPSSKGLARAMVEPVFAEAHTRREPLRVLEVGAGVGPVTEELVARLLPGDRLDVVELNPEFCLALHARFDGVQVPPNIHQVSITEFNPGIRYHHVVSGLPLANFPSGLVESIYDKIFALLEPTGTFVMFEHVMGRELLNTFTAGEARDRIARILQIEAQLEPLVVDRKTVPLNMPPARVLVRRHRETATRGDA